MVENLSPSTRAPILGSPRPLGASGPALVGASGPLDLSSSSFAGSNLATLKREVSGTEDKKFGQVKLIQSSKGIKFLLPGDLCIKALCPFGSKGPCEPNTSPQDHCRQPGMIKILRERLPKIPKIIFCRQIKCENYWWTRRAVDQWTS